MDEEARRQFALDLGRRVAGKEPVPFREVSHGRWRPLAQQCHTNVHQWVSYHPEHRAVQGFRFVPRPALSACAFYAHTVVEDEAGNLFDITPGSLAAPFVHHTGSLEDFAELARGIVLLLPVARAPQNPE
jgi:hypothetical protein